MSRRTVLLIGHTGFMGRALQQRLETADCRVLGFSRSQGGDLARADALDVFAGEPVDLVYHLGASPEWPRVGRTPRFFTG